MNEVQTKEMDYNKDELETHFRVVKLQQTLLSLKDLFPREEQLKFCIKYNKSTSFMRDYLNGKGKDIISSEKLICHIQEFLNFK